MNFKLLKTLLFLITMLTSLMANAYSNPDVWDVLRSQFNLSHETHRPEVQEQIRWLVAHPGYVQTVTKQAEPYIYHIITEVRKRHLPGELALLPMIESAFNPFAYSRVGAAGLWQLMPGTGNDLGLKQDWWYDGRRSISQSTDAALNFLVNLKHNLNNNWLLAIAAYDCGEGCISRAIKAQGMPSQSVEFWQITVPKETKVYVPRLLALAEIISHPILYRVNLPSIPFTPYFTEVNIGTPIDLNHAAKLAGISYKELIKLNPGFNRWTTAPDQPFRLLIPADKVEQFTQNLANMPANMRASLIKHVVQLGDDINSIASRYHTTVNMIKQLNQLKTHDIKINQILLVPSNKGIIATQPSSATTPSFSTLTIPKSHRMIHIVQQNDTWQSIQKSYGVTLAELQQWNTNLNTHSSLRTGQTLTIWQHIKEPTPYIVKAGDTLNQIAKLNNTKVMNLIVLNPQLERNKSLKPGQRILVG